MLASGCAKQSPAPPVAAPDKTISLYNHQLKISDQTLNVQVATTSADMAEGLSDRLSMKDDEGMLFDFGQPGKPAFWMPRMHFDLDLVWIKNNKIIFITPNVPAPVGNWKLEIGNLPLYYPPSPIEQVLEVNAGWTQKNHIAVGDEVKPVQ